jgi:hypothetical protein
MPVLEQDVYYLRSILRQLTNLKTGVAFGRYRSLLGAQVLTDNIEWIDSYIERLEENEPLSCGAADEHSGDNVQRGAGKGAA